MSDFQRMEFVLRGEHIALDALLKAVGAVDSGGRAKVVITEGGVQVDGLTETRRACKIRAGQRVQCAGLLVHVQAGGA